MCDKNAKVSERAEEIYNEIFEKQDDNLALTEGVGNKA